jgi:subtilisin family serine protease
MFHKTLGAVFILLLWTITCNAGFITENQPVKTEGSRAEPFKRPLFSPKELKKKYENSTPANSGSVKKPSKYRDRELIVKFRNTASEAGKKNLHQKHGSVRLKEFPSLRLHHVKLKKGLTVAEAIKEYQADPDVEYAEPNYLVSSLALPNDTRFVELWNLYNTGQSGGASGADINAPSAWDISTGSSDVVVAVIDTGIDYTHPDLMANLWTSPTELNGQTGTDDDGNGYADDIYGYNALTHAGDPLDDFGHGTHVAGIIGAAGDNELGIVGVSWNVKIMSCKFLNAYGYGDSSGAIECLQYVKAMKDRGVNIVATNNSWGGDGYSQALYDAIDAQRDILFIAAAGNDWSDNDVLGAYPADYDLPNVISVAATDANDNKSYFSNYGRRTVHVGAPGSTILSTLPATNYFNITGGYGKLSGTSMAAPHVTGLAALLKAQTPERDWKALKNLILAGGDATAAMQGRTLTGKRINAYGSLTCINSPVFSIVRYPSVYTVGQPVTLSALHIDCDLPAGPVTVTSFGGDTVSLHDDGVAPDGVAGDGIYSGTWVPTRQGERLTFSAASGVETVSVPTLGISNDRLMEANTHALPYSQLLVGRGGVPPYTFSLASGSLPPGLTLDSSTGEISGVPSSTGYFYFTVQVADFAGSSATKTLEIYAVDDSLVEMWAKTYDKGGYELATAIRIDQNDRIHLAGGVSNGLVWNYFAARYDTGGGLLWDSSWDGHSGGANGMTVDGAGNMYLAGAIDNGTDSDFFTAKFDSSGNLLWERTFDNGDEDGAGGVAVDASGNVYVTGASWGGSAWDGLTIKYDAAGNVIWTKRYTGYSDVMPNSIVVDGSGNVVIAGARWSGANLDYIAIKYDPAGTVIWARTYDGGDNDWAYGLATDNGDNIYLTGESWQGNGYNFLTVKYDSAGNYVWAKRYENGDTLASGVTTDGSGNVYVTGISFVEKLNSGGSGYQYFVVKYDSGGNQLWTKQFHAGWWRASQATGIALDSMGDVYVTGYTEPITYAYRPTDILTIKYSFSPVITTSALPDGRVDVPYSQAVTATGGSSPYVWSVSAGTLPDGLLLEGSTGVISGTPTTAGTFNFTVRAMNGQATAKDAKDFSITVSDQLVFATASLPPGAVNRYYSPALAVSGGKSPYTWAISSGSLPGGTTLDPATGVIYGTPTATGLATFSVLVTDANGFIATKSLSISIAATQSLVVTTASLPAGAIATPYSQALSATGGVNPLRWTIAAGKLPGGLILNETTGELSGIPGAAGTFSITVQVADANAYAAYKQLAITVDNLLAITTQVLYATAVDSKYAQKIAATGGLPPYTWSIASGTLPGGVTLNGATGILSGTPVAEGMFPVTVRVVDGRSASVTRDFTIAVERVVWTRGYSGSSSNYGTDIAVDNSGNAYVVGNTYDGAALIKYDQTGNQSWARKPFDGAAWSDIRLATDLYDNLYMTGTVLTSGNMNYITLKYDSEGNEVWRRNYPGDSAYAKDIAVDGSGNVYVTGNAYVNYKTMYVTIKYDRYGNVLWTRTFGAGNGNTASGIALDHDGNIYVTGKTSSGDQYILTVKYDPNGNLLWSKTELSGYSNVEPVIAADRSGNIYVSGKISGGQQTLKYDSSGNKLWNRTFANGDATYFSFWSEGMIVDACGNISIAGYYSNPATSYADILIMRFDSSGNLIGAKTFADGTAQKYMTEAHGIALDNSGNVFVTGEAYGGTTSMITIKYKPDALCITRDTLPAGAVGVGYSFPLTATDAVTWAVSSGSLPAGLTLDPATGLLSGVPATAGVADFVVQATNAALATATKPLSLQIDYMTVTTPSLKAGAQGTAYSQTVTAAGGAPPYAWTVIEGILPNGLNLDGSTGVISGTPTSLGNFSFKVQASDTAAVSVTRHFVISVYMPLVVSTPPVSTGTTGVSYSQTLTASGGLLPYTWTVAAGSLPPGITLNKYSGTLSGTPGAAGTFSCTLQVADSSSLTHSKVLTIDTVDPFLTINSASLPDAKIGAPYLQTLSATGSPATFTWSITAGALPAGLALDGPTGVISGTPTVNGLSGFSVTATNGVSTDTRQFAVTVKYPYVKVSGSGLRYYDLLQSAYNAAASGDTINMQGIDFQESLVLDRNVTVILQGGYDEAYGSIGATTTIHGSITVSNGTIAVNDLVLMP